MTISFTEYVVFVSTRAMRIERAKQFLKENLIEIIACAARREPEYLKQLRSICTRIVERFLFHFDVARGEIIINFSLETRYIVDK